MRFGTPQPSPTRFWRPEPGEPVLLSWWAPLVRAARRAVAEQFPWLIMVDEWQLVGRYKRKGRSDVWIYRHDRSGGELYLDDSGQAHRFIHYSSGPSPGRFTEIGIGAALWRSRLPDVGLAVWWDTPPRVAWGDDDWDPPAADAEGPTRRPVLRIV